MNNTELSSCRCVLGVFGSFRRKSIFSFQMKSHFISLLNSSDFNRFALLCFALLSVAFGFHQSSRARVRKKEDDDDDSCSSREQLCGDDNDGARRRRSKREKE